MFDEENDFGELTSMLDESRSHLRNSLNELNMIYKASKEDWNSNTRRDIAKEISVLIEPLLVLEDYFLQYEEE